MKFKCTKCEETMELQEDKHICPSCDFELTLEEAETQFEAGELLAESEDDNDDLVEDENKDVEKVSVMLSEYKSVSKILRAGKKDQLSEEWIADYIEALVEGTDINIHKIDQESILEWATDLCKEQTEISEDFVQALNSSDDTLDESVQKDVVSVFESAVAMKTKQLSDAYAEKLELELAEKEIEIREDVESEIDGYLDTVVTEWLKENEVAIEAGIKVEQAESFLDGIKELFEDHYMEVPEDKEDVLESLVSQVEELQTQLEEKDTESLKLSEKMIEMKIDSIVESVGVDLAETEKEKLSDLAETVEFVSEEDFNERLTKLKESFIDSKSSKQTDNGLFEGELDDDDKSKKPVSQFDHIAKAVELLKTQQ